MAHATSICLGIMGALTRNFLQAQAVPQFEDSVVSAVCQEDGCNASASEQDLGLHALQLRASSLRREAPAPAAAEEEKFIMGISYGPLPCTGQCEIHMDDFMGEASKALWGQRGRGDLQIISSMGANMVRLYGNSPEADHGPFLDEARQAGLDVTIGMSDYPYTQMDTNCMKTNFDCYEQIKGVYTMNLLKGLMTEDKHYSPALKHVIVINEPDLKLPGMSKPKSFAKGIISALDGMLDAEKELGVQGPLVNFTATVSFGVCSGCVEHGERPALGQMSEIRDAMLSPAKYGYAPKNDLAAAYRTRWINSFNTNAPAFWVNNTFVGPYLTSFPGVPVVIEEYHTPGKNPKTDLEDMMTIMRENKLFYGVSFFEFQTRYDKGGTEANFGMFNLGNFSVNTFGYYGGEFHSWCLTPVPTQYGDVATLVAEAYGGTPPNYKKLCSPDPSKVNLDETGFQNISSQGTESLAVFAHRVANHLGSKIPVDRILGAMAPPASFKDLVQEFQAASKSSPAPAAKCVADRLATTQALGMAIGEACGGMTSFNCSSGIPQACNGNTWEVADYVFSKFYAEKGGNPLENCYFGGAALLADETYVGRKCGMDCCSYDGSNPTPPTPEPTLPPIFTTPPPTTAAPVGPPAPSPAIAGDCSFESQPAIQYFWDESCSLKGGAGCMADGKHLECRYCGKTPFPACPGE